MTADEQLESGGDNPALALFSKYLNPRADSLLARFDFGGFIRDASRGAIIAFWAGLIAIVVAIGEAFNAVVDALGFSIRFPVEGALAALGDLQAEAIGIAAADLREFEILALPVSAAVALAAVLVFALVVRFLWGEA